MLLFESRRRYVRLNEVVCRSLFVVVGPLQELVITDSTVAAVSLATSSHFCVWLSTFKLRAIAFGNSMPDYISTASEIGSIIAGSTEIQSPKGRRDIVGSVHRWYC